MSGESDVILANCQFGYTTDAVVAGEGNKYIPVHGVNEIGEIGLMAERKSKTNLADKQKKYGPGMQDSPEKAIKGQVIPFKDTGDAMEGIYDIQQAFFAVCKAKTPFMVQLLWDDGETSEFLYEPLGMSIEAPDSAEWKKFNIGGSQNSDVTTIAPTKTPSA